VPNIEQHIQLFGGVDAQSAPHLIATDQVQTATNIDFSFENGAAVVRRGSSVYQALSESSAIHIIYRHYNNPNSIDASPYYYAASDGDVYRVIAGTPTKIITGSGSAQSAISQFKNHAYIASVGSVNNLIKDDGISFTDWVKQAPLSPSVTLNTLSPLSVATVFTCSEGTGGGTGTATASSTSTNYRITLEATPTSTNLNSNSGDIGDYGVDFLSILISNPSIVSRISRDYSIGGTDFTNYYHTEMDLQFNDVEEVMPDPETLIQAEQTDGNLELSNEDRDTMTTEVRQAIRAPLTRVSAAANTFNAWGVMRPHFEFIGKYTATSGASGWEDIQKVRIIVEASGPVSIQVKDWEVRGNRSYFLNDPNVGYTWWQTFATYDSSNNLMGESAPSDPSDRFQCQFSQATLVSTATATGNHGITHVHWYRQGGYMKDAYCVGTSSVGNGTSGALVTATYTDTLNDIQALAAGERLVTNLYSKSDMPNGFRAVSEPHMSRLFLIEGNRLRWSLPGQPDSIPKTSVTQVSHEGDIGLGLVSWNNALVIVNRDSVYEMNGHVFEGTDSNWQLTRSGSRHGTKLLRSVIKTPYGIPLIDYDGIYMYQPGQGIDYPLDWAMAAIGDAFKGTQSSDPATYKGDRVPPINMSYLHDSVMAFANNRLYIAVPYVSNTVPNVIFVLDFSTKRVWWYHYTHISITSLYWDAVHNRLLAGTSAGQIIQLESGTMDTDNTGTAQPVLWNVRTRAWSVPSDTIAQNAWVELQGGNAGNITLQAQYDYAGNTSLGTYTGTGKQWQIPSLNGTFVNEIDFYLTGTQTGTRRQALYQLGFEALSHPKRVQFQRTDHTAVEQGERLWDISIADIEVINEGTGGTATVLATQFVDEAVVMTNTFTHTSTSGRQVYHNPFPIPTYGEVAYTIYKVAGTNTAHVFKLWGNRYVSRPEPPRINTYRTDITSGEEVIIDAMDVDVNPNGTLTSTVFVDNVAVSTFTTTGTNQQSYTHALPNETYGRTIYAIHNGTQFKHYNTWFHTRNEPDRWTNYVTPRQSADEGIWDTFNVDIDILSGTTTVLATAFIDNNPLTTATLVGTKRQSFVHSMPSETYGRTGYVVYNATGGRFKHYNTWWDVRQEPDRVTNYVTPRISGEEQIWDGVNFDIDCLTSTNTVLAAVIIDGAAVSTATITGTARQSYTFALPNETYGRTAYVVMNCTTGQRFKPYSVWFDQRPEPDRYTNYTTPRESGEEHLWDNFNADLNIYHGICLATVMLDNAVLTTLTLTGGGRQSYVQSLPSNSYGRTAYVIYNQQGGLKFKHYSTWFDKRKEPDRVLSVQSEVFPYPANQHLKTWIPELNPLNGTCTGTVYADNNILTTHTFTGNHRQRYNVGLDVTNALVLQDAKTLRVIYSSTTPFKHYSTDFETETDPYSKTTWSVTYKKIGGATQLDMARYWSIELTPSSGTATITAMWDVDGRTYHTDTLTFTSHEWRDRIPFPPDGRGYLFQLRLLSNSNVTVHKSSLDVVQVGIKGLVRHTLPGTPN
jgi:hypothetical protein